MKNKLTDLNDLLFAQLERLASDDLDAEQITQEVQRATSMVQIADRIVDTARLQLDGAKFVADHGGKLAQLPATMAIPATTGPKA
jgi:hypothetical protein